MMLFPAYMGAVHPAASASGGGIPTRSVDFVSSSSQYLSMSDTNFGSYDRTKFALVFSLYPRSVSGGYVVNKRHSDIEWWCDLSSGKLRFFTWDASSNQSQYTTGTSLSANAWTAVMIRFDGAAAASARVRVWINGTEDTPATYSNPGISVKSTSDMVAWGAEGGGGNYFNGKLFSAAFVSGSLPDAASVFDGAAGKLKDLTGLSGLKSLLDVAGGDVTSDGVLTPAWTNNGSTASTTDVP